MTDNSTSARLLMKAGGETCKVTGLTISTASILYAMKYLTSAGCSVVEYLPHLFNPTTTKSFVEHMGSQNNATWTAVFSTLVLLTSGIVVRKVGTMLSDDIVIARVERFLYRTGKPVNDTE